LERHHKFRWTILHHSHALRAQRKRQRPAARKNRSAHANSKPASISRPTRRRRAKLHRRHRTHRSLRHDRNAEVYVLGLTTDDTDQFSFVMSSKVETALISNSERWLVITIFGSTSLPIAITRYFISA